MAMGGQANWRGGPEIDSWGVAPPYGAYRGHYGNYALSQIGQVGSGLLGGPSSVGFGGSFDDKPFEGEAEELGWHEAEFADAEGFPPE
jgi:hypothetical protein